jgi:hypothetical protein
MKLIDADALKKDLKSVTLSNETLVNTNAVLYLLEEYPTAYDIDGVVEQLKRCYGIVRSTSVDYAEGLKDAYERAIGIVEGGGMKK